jgi:hypothetical protein
MKICQTYIVTCNVSGLIVCAPECVEATAVRVRTLDLVDDIHSLFLYTLKYNMGY